MLQKHVGISMKMVTKWIEFMYNHPMRTHTKIKLWKTKRNVKKKSHFFSRNNTNNFSSFFPETIEILSVSISLITKITIFFKKDRFICLFKQRRNKKQVNETPFCWCKITLKFKGFLLHTWKREEEKRKEKNSKDKRRT